MMLSRTIAITELIWTIVATPGLLVWVLLLRYIMSIHRTARKNYNRSNMVVANAMLVLGIAGLATEIVFVSWGIFGMTQPQVVQRITPLGWAFTIGIVLIATLATVVGIVLRRAIAIVWKLATQNRNHGDN